MIILLVFVLGGLWLMIGMVAAISESISDKRVKRITYIDQMKEQDSLLAKGLEDKDKMKMYHRDINMLAEKKGLDLYSISYLDPETNRYTTDLASSFEEYDQSNIIGSYTSCNSLINYYNRQLILKFGDNHGTR